MGRGVSRRLLRRSGTVYRLPPEANHLMLVTLVRSPDKDICDLFGYYAGATAVTRAPFGAKSPSVPSVILDRA